MPFPGSNYAPPNVYTRTFFDSPNATSFAGVRIPTIIGEGNEILTNENLEVVRGSSSSVDQRVIQEDVSARAVLSISNTNQTTLGSFDGVITRFQVRNFPIVNGNGSGTVTNDRGAVSVRIDGQPAVVSSLDGVNGIVQLVEAPSSNAVVDITYFFNRTDTSATDNVSAQVTSDQATLSGEIGLGSGGVFEFNTSNNELTLTVDRNAEQTITFPASNLTPTQVANFITGAGIGTLTASVFTNNFGNEAIQLVASEDIVVGDGSANALLGFTNAQTSGRNRTFFVFQGPIVDGSNGGLTTTDPADVTVTVNGTSVTPTAVDGQTRAVTLPYAPAPGSTVNITYFFNTWQDTFDYLANPNVTDVIRAGITPGRNDFIEGADFVLQDDVVVWGSASLVSAVDTTSGATPFGPSQVTSTLVDNRIFLAEATAVVDTSVIPSVENRLDFQLPFQPTLGNGRANLIGQSQYLELANGRVDVSTNRPDLIQAYWGFDIQDALARGAQTVVKLDAENQVITFSEAVPVGAKVYATFYYNVLTDNTYTLTSKFAGVSGVGTYTVQDQGGNDLHEATFNLGTKGIGLNGVVIEFPSGSELNPDFNFLTVNATSFTGPVEEIVTVTFSTYNGRAAKFTVRGPAPYSFIENESDKLRIRIDNAELASGLTGLDLSDINGNKTGFFASVVGDEIEYDASTGGATYTLDATNNALNLTVDDVLLSPSVTPGAGLTVADFVTAINTAAKAGGSAAPSYVAAGRFNGSYTVVATEYDELTLHYTGDTSGASGDQVITLSPGVYATAADLASEVNTQLSTINGIGGLNGTVTCTATANGQLRFTLTRDAADTTAGFLEFISNATPASDFAILAGIDTAAATGNGQTKLLDGDIARRFTVGTAPLRSDRLILRNRLLPGEGSVYHKHVTDQAALLVQNASGNAKTGLSQGFEGKARNKASVEYPTLLGLVGFVGGQITGAADATDSQPLVTFYDGTGTNAANNEFEFLLDGNPVSVSFTASGSGTETALGPESVAGTIIEQIQQALAALPGAPFGNLAAVQSANIVRQEGAGLRLVSPSVDSTAEVTINDGSANDVLGFSDGQTSIPAGVEAEELAAALMSHAHASGSFNNLMLDFANPTATYFAAEALAYVETDQVNNKYLFIQSQSLGVGSVVEFQSASAEDALSQGTGFFVTAGQGDVGESATSGFYVTSTNPNGSGSANTSVFNSGTGQDGFVGQTYIDQVTGLSFTILPRQGNLAYPTANADFRINVSKTFLTDANRPTRSLPGLELLVTNTNGVLVGDTGQVRTFEKGGQEPAIGDLYYITYEFTKQEFDAQLFTQLTAVTEAFGPTNPENPVSLAAYLAFLNDAVLLAIKQTPKVAGTNAADQNAYLSALNDLRTPLPGGVTLDTLTPLAQSNLFFLNELSKHVDLLSDIRRRQERTAIYGLQAGTQPAEAINLAQSISNTRMRQVYPDAAELTITDTIGTNTTYLVEGPFIAAALAGNLASPSYDVATPWTKRRLVGFDNLARSLDPVQQNQIAINGVTLLDFVPPQFLEVRHGLTTDFTNILTRTPTVIQIADEVQRQARATLEQYIGIKNLPGISSQIEGNLANTLKNLQRAQIISSYTNVSANVTDDPTIINTEAYYTPIFPILYIVINFFLRSQL